MNDQYNPFEPPETDEERARRVGGMIRENIDRRLEADERAIALKAAIAEGERVNRIIEAALDCRGLRVGDAIRVRKPLTHSGYGEVAIGDLVMDSWELVLITSELWARIEARR